MNYLLKIYRHFANDSLYRNSIYLMLSTGIMAFFGFFFWIINARLFTTEQVGLATTMISAMGLITSFSVLGLDSGIIRYLPQSKNKNDKINTCFSAVFIMTVIVTVIFLLGLNKYSPKLMFIRQNIIFDLLFIFFMVISSINVLIDSIFVALRNTKYVLIKNTVFSVLKIVFSFVLITLGTFGIFGSWMIALGIGLGISIIVLLKRFDFKPQLTFKNDTIKEIGRFSFGNYISSSLVGLPIMVFPLMITNIIGPQITAYYYMAMMIASLLFVIPTATTQSLFAEGSHNEKDLKRHVIKAIQIISLILSPAILITIFLGNYILLAFGKNYSSEGFEFLQIIALSGIFISINSIFRTILKVRHKIKKLIIASLFESAITIGLGYLLISRGLLGIGFAWLFGQGLVSLSYLIYLGLRVLVQKKQIWSIGLYFCKSPFNPIFTQNINNPVLTANDVTDVPAEFVADPFVIKKNNDWYMFFEVFNKHSRKGEIGVATSIDGINWKYKQIILKELFHLSYPYVFEWKNAYYMIPESCNANSIRLYKAIDFPVRWSFVKNLLEGNDYVDSSVFHLHNKWWLFTSSTKSNILRLFYSQNLVGPWIEHPLSPVINENAKIARPGGRILLQDNRIIRYTQNDDKTYGNSVRAFEIVELTTTKYREIDIKENPVLKASGIGWNAKGMHHIDPLKIGENKWIVYTDGNTEKFKFGFND